MVVRAAAGVAAAAGASANAGRYKGASANAGRFNGASDATVAGVVSGAGWAQTLQ